MFIIKSVRTKVKKATLTGNQTTNSMDLNRFSEFKSHSADQDIPPLYGTWKLLVFTVSTKSRQWKLSCARRIQLKCRNISSSYSLIISMCSRFVIKYRIVSNYTGRVIMFSVITKIYKKKTKGPTLMELFTATGKLKKFFWQLEMFDVCTTGDTAHIDTIFKFLPHASTCWRVFL
jgi:hypothetical protein